MAQSEAEQVASIKAVEESVKLSEAPAEEKSQEKPLTSAEPEVTVVPKVTPEPEPASIRLVMVGDMLMHE